jgi:hypothetical protein
MRQPLYHFPRMRPCRGPYTLSSWLTLIFRSRRDGRSANGTLTFRRSSTTPLSQSSNLPPASDNAVQPPSVEVPIAQPTTYEVGPSRYSKDDLLEMYNSQHPGGDPSPLFISGWDPSNGVSAGVRGWGKSNDNHVPQDPGTCWDAGGETAPIGLQGFSPDEREVRDEIYSCFGSQSRCGDVNSLTMTFRPFLLTSTRH